LKLIISLIAYDVSSNKTMEKVERVMVYL